MKGCPSCQRHLKDLQTYCKDCGWNEAPRVTSAPTESPTLLKEMERFQKCPGESSEDYLARLKVARGRMTVVRRLNA